MLRKFWQRITSSHATRQRESFAHMERAMKEEIARLRAENRALLNSILGIAGIPPIVISEAEATTEAAMLNIVSPISASDFAVPSRSAGVSPANLTLPLNLLSRAEEENQNRRRDAGATNPAPPRPDKPESPAPKPIRFKP